MPDPIVRRGAQTPVAIIAITLVAAIAYGGGFFAYRAAHAAPMPLGDPMSVVVIDGPASRVGAYVFLPALLGDRALTGRFLFVRDRDPASMEILARIVEAFFPDDPEPWHC